jgi:hypothetical protein
MLNTATSGSPLLKLVLLLNAFAGRRCVIDENVEPAQPLVCLPEYAVDILGFSTLRRPRPRQSRR